MTPPNNYRPAVLGVSTSLREARERRDIGLRPLARQIGISPSRLHALEQGVNLPHEPDVARVLGFLRISGAEYDRIIKLARHVDDVNYLEEHASEAVGLTRIYEQLATRIVEWAPHCIPELLRTQRAGQACSETRDLEPFEHNVGRQEVQDGIHQYLFLIGENALSTAKTGPGAVEQICRVRTVASLPHVTVRIVPTAGHDPGNAFTIFEVDRASVAVAIKSVHCTAYLTEKALLDKYSETADALNRRRLRKTATALSNSPWELAS
ncbi:Scr1 family TA system antitoxin-like transcriptional regulator [Amycolatopsis sp. cmx-4-83]|uniref:Scr1 family TA system antitoxin-like transcriptional regulator n=1 Tax=Amycolatopsis sp. cmx-4-83 TaxID=2790940 RepID=UPI003977E93E